MSVWLTIPSARPPAEANAVLKRWTDAGYRVAVWRDTPEPVHADIRLTARTYPGYARAVNALAHAVLRVDDGCQFVVVAGDDVWPDPNLTADQIEAQLVENLGGTLGVMQPTGDPHMVDAEGRCAAERCAVTPFVGREWCERGYMGMGPLWGGYFHEGVDLDLHHVATKLGLLWHRSDLCHHHDWWGRTGQGVPEHLRDKGDANRAGKELFKSRQAMGFPNSGLR